MTRKIYAIALALGMFAALSTPSHAALSGADRPAVTTTPAQGAVEANASPGFATDAAAATTATATPVAQAAPVTELRKPAVKAKPRIASAPQFASAPAFSARARYGYPCH